MHHHRAAFTLIEAMIALALGLVLIFTAASGFRVASQAATVASRMSLENAMLRAGFQTAHEQLDFWTDIDDPDGGPVGMALRQRGTNNEGGAVIGMPFTPFKDTWSGPDPDPNSKDESSLGWDPQDRAWSADNPRGWFQGDMAQKCTGGELDLRSGRYALFTNTADNLGTGDFTAINTKTYGPISIIPHHWRDRTVAALINSLGFMGLCEYLPANAVYSLYSPARSGGPYWTSTDMGGIPSWCTLPGGSFENGDGGQQTTRGKYRSTYMTSYCIPNPAYSATPDLLGDLRRYYHVGYENDAGAMQEFDIKTVVPAVLLQARPTTWPRVAVSVARFIKNARHVALCKVRWQSPVTGEVIELSFAGFGTSLRGARQQRQPTTGWAAWDNAASVPTKPAGTFTIPLNLDSR